MAHQHQQQHRKRGGGGRGGQGGGGSARGPRRGGNNSGGGPVTSSTSAAAAAAAPTHTTEELMAAGVPVVGTASLGDFSSGKSAAAVAAAAAAFAAEVRRQRSDSIRRSLHAGVPLANEPLLQEEDEHGPGVLGFMRRTRSDSTANEPQPVFAMDDHVPPAHAPRSLHASHPHATHVPTRRGSVESELAAGGSDSDESSGDDDDENRLLDHTKRISIKRAKSPTEDGCELESALLNQAAASAVSASAGAAAAAASSSSAATPIFAGQSGSIAIPLPHPLPLQHTGLSVGDFELLKVIGRGAYGKVFLCRAHATGRLYAMKSIHKSEAIKKNVVSNMRSEREVLEAVRHPFIVNLRFAFQTHSKLYLVLDYVGGGELFTRLSANKDHSLPMKDARFYAAEIVLAIEHLHKLDIIYRDLKPENVLLHRDGHVVLTDMGFAKAQVREVDKGTDSFCGTLCYLAPEIVEYAGHGKGSDWWALGILLFEMLTGNTPFGGGGNRATIQKNILTAPLKLPKWMDAPTKSILTELLRRPIHKRLGCGPTGAAAVKKHAFFAGIDWTALEKKKVAPPFVPPTGSGPEDTLNFDSKFTMERVVDTPVSPSQMASMLQGQGISPSAFHTADQTFANFFYRRDHTPGQSPALRAMVGAMEIARRQSSTGSTSGLLVAMASPRILSGRPPPHNHLHHADLLDLPAVSLSHSATATIAAAAAAESAAAAAAADTSAAPLSPKQHAAAKSAAWKEKQAATAAAAASSVAAAAASPAASGAAASSSPSRRVRKPKAVKATPSPPPIAAESVLENGNGTSSASMEVAPHAVASAAPKGGEATSELSKQLAQRKQQNQPHQQQPAPQTVAAGAIPTTAPTSNGIPSSSARPASAAPGPAWRVKGAAASTNAPLVAAAPVACANGVAVELVSSIAASAGVVPMASAPATAPAAVAAAPPVKKLSALKLSAGAAVFVPGAAWGAQTLKPQPQQQQQQQQHQHQAPQGSVRPWSAQVVPGFPAASAPLGPPQWGAPRS